jgi:hypothetical protein
VAIQTAKWTTLCKNYEADPRAIDGAAGFNRVNAPSNWCQGVHNGIHTFILDDFCKISINLEVFFQIANSG